MLIGEFSCATGLTADTLRYYEQLGLLRPARDTGGRRVYSEADIAWVEFVLRLRDTGMPLAEIGKYAVLRERGDATLSERLHMLEAHRDHLSRNIADLQMQKDKLDEKIKFYRDEIHKGCEDKETQ